MGNFIVRSGAKMDSNHSQESSFGNLNIFLGLLAVITVVVIFYWPITEFRFVNWDDNLHIYKNPALFPETNMSLFQRLAPKHLGYPMPTTMATYHLDRWLYGAPNPLASDLSNGRGAHITQLFLILFLVAAIYFFLLFILKDWRWGLFATLLFALHPVVVEPFVWLSGRKDLLALLFSVLATLFWLLALQKKRWSYFFLSSLGATLALGSKPTAIFLAPLFFVLFWLQKDEDWSWKGKKNRPLFVSFFYISSISLLFFFWSYTWQNKVGAIAHQTIWMVFRRAWWALGFHLSLVFAPFDLQPRYFAHPTSLERFDFIALIAILALSFLLWRAKRSQKLALLLAWLILAYLPTSNLIPLTRYVADTYAFFPMLALSGLLAFALQQLTLKIPLAFRKWMFFLSFLLIFFLSSRTILQIPHWRSPIALWKYSYHLTKHPRNCLMLAHAYATLDFNEKTAQTYQYCIQQHGKRLFAVNLGIIYFILKKYQKAKPWLTWAWITTGDPRAARYLKLIEYIERHPASTLPTSRKKPTSRPKKVEK